MSTVESKLYGKSLVNALYHGNKPLSFTFNYVDVKPHKETQSRVTQFIEWEPSKPIPDHIPTVSRWKLDLTKFADSEYSEPYLMVTHLDGEGKTVRVLDCKRQRNGKYEITHVANPCELMVISVMDSSYGSQIALITGFFVSNTCIVSDAENPLLALEAYHRYNNHSEDHPARDIARKLVLRSYREQELLFGFPQRKDELRPASYLLNRHFDRIESLSSDLSRKGHISSGHRNSIVSGRTSTYAIAYEDVKEHIGKGAEFVGGLIQRRMDDLVSPMFEDRLIYDEDTFHSVVDFCNQYNADDVNKTKLQIVLFPKNRQDIFYAFPSLDEFNRATDMGCGMYMLHAVFSRYQYLHYCERDFVRSEHSIDKDKTQHHTYISYVKPDAPDESFLDDFKGRINRRSYFGMGGNDTKTRVDAVHDEFIGAVGKEPVVGLMKRINAEEKLAHDNCILNDTETDMISVKCVNTTLIVQVRDIEVEEPTEETPNI